MVYCVCGMLLFSILTGCINVSLDRDQNGWVVGKVHYLNKSWRPFPSFGRQVHYVSCLSFFPPIHPALFRVVVQKEGVRKMLTRPFPIFPRRKSVSTMFLEGTRERENERRGGGFACSLRHNTLHCTTKRQGGGKRAGFAWLIHCLSSGLYKVGHAPIFFFLFASCVMMWRHACSLYTLSLLHSVCVKRLATKCRCRRYDATSKSPNEWIACASLGVTIVARVYPRQRQTYIETRRKATFGCTLPIVTHSHLAGTDGTALVSASFLILIPWLTVSSIVPN